MLIAFILVWANTVYAQTKLKAKIPALCYECHKELKKGLSDRYIHFLFKQGKCITCHSSHVSKIKGLMKEEITSLCLKCHENLRNLIKKATLHSALKENDCTECHHAHSGKNKYLLIKAEKNLCLGCHENVNKQLGDPYACLPFKEGKCSACHDSHASLQDALLIAPPSKLCKKCHAIRCKVGRVSIASAVKEISCTTCHSGHSSQNKGLLGPYGHRVFLDKDCGQCHEPITAKREITIKMKGEELCFSCHKRNLLKYIYVDNDVHVKDAKNPCNICHDYHASDKKNLTMKESRLCINCHEDTEKRTIAMERRLKSIKCIPVKERKCFECHLPAHSELPLDYRADEISLCARCHEAQHKITHPLGSDVIDIRTGQPVTCVSCHSMHSSKAEFMLTHDRRRALCIQCHKM
jgi:predicted CXXCH cytochrome family protein